MDCIQTRRRSRSVLDFFYTHTQKAFFACIFLFFFSVILGLVWDRAPLDDLETGGWMEFFQLLLLLRRHFRMGGVVVPIEAGGVPGVGGF